MCIKCGTKLKGKQNKYCSIRCKNTVAVAKRRRTLKEMALIYMGEKCKLCGYSRCAAALEFHHPNNDKEFGIAASGLTRSWDRIKAELDKCILLCSNCHAEIHWRVV